MKFRGLVCLLHFTWIFAFGTHNKGGEITYQHISGFSYRIKIVTYTNTAGAAIQADRPFLDSVSFGDGTLSSFTRTGLR